MLVCNLITFLKAIEVDFQVFQNIWNTHFKYFFYFYKVHFWNCVNYPSAKGFLTVKVSSVDFWNKTHMSWCVFASTEMSFEMKNTFSLARTYHSLSLFAQTPSNESPCSSYLQHSFHIFCVSLFILLFSSLIWTNVNEEITLKRYIFHVKTGLLLYLDNSTRICLLQKHLS